MINLFSPGLALLCALILAAGPGRRIGGRKQLLELGGKPMLQHVIDLACSLPFERVLVVLGAHEEEIRKAIRFDRAEPLVNPHYEEGLASSLRLGFSALCERCEAVAIFLGDQPFVRRETVLKLLREFQRARPLIVVPTYRGQRGNPCIASSGLRDEVARLRGDVGLRALFPKYAPRIRYVPVEDPGILLDVDTAGDYERARWAFGAKAGQ